MGWDFPWYSSGQGTFNIDFHVSFTPEQREHGAEYNYRTKNHPSDEACGLSVFAAHEGDLFHTYSSYERGTDAINSCYQLLDLVPKGRDEQGFSWSMEWLRRHDAYD